MLLPCIDWILKSSCLTHKVDENDQLWSISQCSYPQQGSVWWSLSINCAFKWHAHVHHQQQWLCTWAQANVWKCQSTRRRCWADFDISSQCVLGSDDSSVSCNYCCVFCALVLMFCHTVPSYVILFNYDHISSTNKAHRFTSSVCIPPCFGHFF